MKKIYLSRRIKSSYLDHPQPLGCWMEACNLRPPLTPNLILGRTGIGMENLRYLTLGAQPHPEDCCCGAHPTEMRGFEPHPPPEASPRRSESPARFWATWVTAGCTATGTSWEASKVKGCASTISTLSGEGNA